MKIFLDIDEVLADFRSAAARLHGQTGEEMDQLYGVGHWHGGSFFKPIHQRGTRFWDELDDLPWSRQLIQIVKEYDEDFRLVSQPTLHETSYSGKALWVAKRFPLHKLILTMDKSLLASPTAVLIDDTQRNCDQFVKKGGHSILFPTTYRNGQREIITVEWIRDQLEELKLRTDIHYGHSSQQNPREQF